METSILCLKDSYTFFMVRHQRSSIVFGLAIVLETSHCVFLGHKTATGEEKKNKQTLCPYSSSVCLFADSQLHVLHSISSSV